MREMSLRKAGENKQQQSYGCWVPKPQPKASKIPCDKNWLVWSLGVVSPGMRICFVCTDCVYLRVSEGNKKWEVGTKMIRLLHYPSRS